MRRLIRTLITTGISLYLVSLVLPGFGVSGGIRALTVTSLILTLVTKFINLITFGLFRWVTPTLTLYLISRLSPDLTITDLWTLIFASFLLSLSQSTLRWLW